MCFSISWVENLLIYLVVLIAIVALLKLAVSVVLPMVASWPVDIIARAINIIIWAIVAIALIMFIFDLISCLLPLGRIR